MLVVIINLSLFLCRVLDDGKVGVTKKTTIGNEVNNGSRA